MTDASRRTQQNPHFPMVAQSRSKFLMQVLDGFALSLDGQLFPISNRKARAMLAFLTIERSLAVTRERLAGLLWPDVGEQQARTSLRQMLFELRAALGTLCDSLLLLDRETVTLDHGAVQTDIEAALNNIESGVVPAMLSRPQLGERLLVGLEDISPLFQAWLTGIRQATEQRLRRALEQGLDNTSLPAPLRRHFAETCLQLDPTDEAACRTLMRLSAEAGETSVALRAYSSLYEVLDSEHDTEPSALTQELIADIKRGLLDPTGGSAAPYAPPEPARMARSSTFFGSVPVVAVLPFRGLGPHPIPPYLADGLVEDVVCMLASLREPVALSSCSTRLVQSDGVDANRTCEQLGAQYFVTGSIRLSTGHARISVQLAEVSSRAVLWGQSYDIAASEMFDAQGMIAARVAQTLAPRVQEAELRRSRRCRPEDLDAYQLLLQARDLTYRMDLDSYSDALPLLQRGLQLDPGFSALYAALANWYCLRIFQGWSPDRAADTEAVLSNARAALQADPGHPRMLALLGHTRMLTARRYDEALTMHRRALESAPNDSEAWMFSSATFAYIGDGAEAVRRAERALALSPCDPLLHQYEHYCCIAHYAAGNYEAAAKYGQSSFERNPNLVSNLRMTAAALAGLGRRGQAREIAANVLRLEPGFSVRPWIEHQAFRDSRQRQQYGTHLIEAGLPP